MGSGNRRRRPVYGTQAPMARAVPGYGADGGTLCQTEQKLCSRGQSRGLTTAKAFFPPWTASLSKPSSLKPAGKQGDSQQNAGAGKQKCWPHSRWSRRRLARAFKRPAGGYATALIGAGWPPKDFGSAGRRCRKSTADLLSIQEAPPAATFWRSSKKYNKGCRPAAGLCWSQRSDFWQGGNTCSFNHYRAFRRRRRAAPPNPWRILGFYCG